MTLFKRATKAQAKLRLALAGPSGSGKTYTALQTGILLADGGAVACIDTEHGSASKYASLFAFDVLELDSFSPLKYVEAIKAAEQAGYAVLIIDSLSHAWIGKDGALEQKDRAAKRGGGNSFDAWREVTPLHNQLVEAMIGARLHVIVTLRSKQEYVQEKDERTGKTRIRKVGMAPVQRDGIEYEFDVYGELTAENELIIGKTRCPELAGQVISKPGHELADTLRAWLSDGAEAPARQTPPVARPAAAAPKGAPARATTADAKQAMAERAIENAPALTPIDHYRALIAEAQEAGLPSQYWDELPDDEDVETVRAHWKQLRARVDEWKATGRVTK